MKNRIRVGFIMPEVFHGGAETQFRILIENMNPERFAVSVFVEQSYGGNDRRRSQSWISSHPNIRFILLAGLSGTSHPLAAARLVLQLLPHLRRREFDCVVVYSGLALRLTPLLRIFGVYTVYSERNSGSYSRCKLLAKRPFFAAANTVVCNSASAVQNFSRYGFSAQLIENAVIQPSKPNKILSGRREGLTLLVPGRIVPLKNQLLVLRALPLIDSLVSRVVLAGAYENPDYLEELKRAVAQLPHKASVEFVGHVDDMDVLYSDAHLVVLPSRAEGLPNVLLEALVRNVPCLASDIPPNRAVLRGNEKMLFGVDDPAAVARAVRWIAGLAPDALRRLTDSQKEYVSERFSVEKMITSYEQIIAAGYHPPPANRYLGGTGNTW